MENPTKHITWITLSVFYLFINVICDPVVFGCGGYSETFIADSDNPCIYYRCVNARLLGGAFHCAPGSGTLRGYVGPDNPCAAHDARCPLPGSSGGHGHGQKPYPGQRPYPGQGKPSPGQKPYPGQPYPGQPYPGQPYPGQPYPGQPYPGQPYPGQPYPGQPYPGQPYPGQPYPGQPYPGQPYPGQPYPGPGQPYPGGSPPGREEPSPSPSPSLSPVQPSPVPTSTPRPSPSPSPAPTREHTTTLAPTTATTPALTIPAGIVTEFYPGQHIRGGLQQPGAMDPVDCLAICSQLRGCVGFDYNLADRTCFLHSDETECSPLIDKIDCVHFRLTNNCSAVEPTEPGQPRIPNIVESFPGKHLFGGQLKIGVNELITCLAMCGQDCAGIDFDFRDATCFHHGPDSECGLLNDKPEVTHFRLRDICPDFRSGSTSNGTQNGGSQNGGRQNGGSQNDTVVNGIPPGYVDRIEGFHILGGTLIGSNVNERQCLDVCLMTPSCLNVDYDRTFRTCWSHAAMTYCTTPQPQKDVVHYRRVPCLDSGRPDVTLNVYAETLYQFQVPGAPVLCRGCSLNQCLEICAYDDLCLGVDVDNRTSTCFRHTAATVCQEPRAKVYCNHYRKVPCVDSVPTLAPIPAPPLPQSSSNINFDTPTVLPSGWGAYPGVNLAGAGLAGAGVTGDECLQLCAADQACQAFDFDASSGGCWLHDARSKCNPTNSAPLVYHAKKTPICERDSAGEAYIIPAGINPGPGYFFIS